ncbi:hypothetical protein SBA2_670021 [Acidobacteriia bacterium SbA2]|nr:hypothetical protein SBA2_670021 [Acidobacteriia bacterium SbA2]
MMTAFLTLKLDAPLPWLLSALPESAAGLPPAMAWLSHDGKHYTHPAASRRSQDRNSQ